MANQYTTLIDVVRAKDPYGYFTKLADTFSRTNEILNDFVYAEGNYNGGDSFRFQAVAGLPTAYTRNYNEGISVSSPIFNQVTVDSQEFSAMSSLDYSLPNASTLLRDMSQKSAVMELQARRLDRGLLHVEAIAQEVAKRLFTPRSASSSDYFYGFRDIYAQTHDHNDYVIESGAPGDAHKNTSFYLVNWGSKVFSFCPPGTTAGFRHIDFGLVSHSSDTDHTQRYPSLDDFFSFKFGLVVKDVRAAARIRNVGLEGANSVGGSSDSAAAGYPKSRALLETLEKAMIQLEGSSDGMQRIYMSKSGYHKLRVALNRAGKFFPGGWVASMNQGGTPSSWGYYQTFKLCRCDGIPNDE